MWKGDKKSTDGFHSFSPSASVNPHTPPPSPQSQHILTSARSWFCKIEKMRWGIREVLLHLCCRQYVFWRGCQKAGCLTLPVLRRCPSIALPCKATSGVVVIHVIKGWSFTDFSISKGTFPSGRLASTPNPFGRQTSRSWEKYWR